MHGKVYICDSDYENNYERCSLKAWCDFAE